MINKLYTNCIQGLNYFNVNYVLGKFKKKSYITVIQLIMEKWYTSKAETGKCIIYIIANIIIVYMEKGYNINVSKYIWYTKSVTFLIDYGYQIVS